MSAAFILVITLPLPLALALTAFKGMVVVSGGDVN